MKRWLLSVLLLASSSALALASAREAGWHPLGVLWGSDSAAISELHRLANIADAFLHHRKIDAPTQAFIDGVLSDLADFDLGKLQRRLPHESADGARELWVQGALQGEDYVIAQPSTPPSVSAERGRAGLVVRGKRLWTVNERKAYSFGGRGSLGIGDVRWERVVAAAEDAARLVSTDAVASSADARQRAQRAHPMLHDEDLAVLGIAFDAYPVLSAFLSRFGTVQNVRTVWSDRGYQQINVALRGVPALYEREFPLAAKYAKELSDIVRARGRWVDGQGRTLALATVDSKELTASVSCYLKDGRLLPFRGNEVFEDQAIDPMSDALAHTKLIATANLKMFGVSIKLSDAELDAHYVPHADYAEFGASFTKVPQVEVSGAVLGFISTEMVDAFIPGTIAGLTRDFLTIAATSHGGAHATAKAGATGKGSVIAGEGEGVALDNALIRMAMAMVNDRMLPTPALIAEVERIADGAHAAFMQDLTSYEGAR
jgi:hypothetical protein